MHIGSFLGFAPIDQPRIAVLVTVHEAQVPVDYGSATAAPFARQILEEALPYLGIRKQDPKATSAPLVSVPDVTGLSLTEAKKALSEAGLQCETDGVSDQVSAQTPAAGAQLSLGGRVMLYTYEEQPLQAQDLMRVPDVKGLPIVEASRALRARGFEMTLTGTGLAVFQSPAAGTYAAQGETVNVTFELPVNGEK